MKAIDIFYVGEHHVFLSNNLFRDVIYLKLSQVALGRGKADRLTWNFWQQSRMDHGGGKIGDKISWDTLPQTTFLTICQIKKRKLSFPSPTPCMQCCATVRATCRKQSTPQLWMQVGVGGEGLYCSPKLQHLKTIEWLSFTLASNEKRHFVPRDQVSHLLVVYCSLFLHTNE